MNKIPSYDPDVALTPEIERSIKSQVDENGNVIFDYCFLDEYDDPDESGARKLLRTVLGFRIAQVMDGINVHKVNGSKVNVARYSSRDSDIVLEESNELAAKSDDRDFSKPDIEVDEESLSESDGQDETIGDDELMVTDEDDLDFSNPNVSTKGQLSTHLDQFGKM